MAFKLELDGQIHALTILARRPHLVVGIDGKRYTIVDAGEAGDGERLIALEGETVRCARAETAQGALVRIAGRSFAIRHVDASDEAAGGGGAHVVRAPMPGIVVAVHKAPGDHVRRGETVITIESMKLQMKLDAPRDGEIGEIDVRPGEGFDKDAVLARLVATAAES